MTFVNLARRYFIAIVILGCANLMFSQADSLQTMNSLFPNFEPYSTPRTNGRPGTVYRVDKEGVTFYVEDVSTILSKSSDEGDIIGRMLFTKDQLFQILNLEFAIDEAIWVEVELSKVIREYNEQTQLDELLWEKGKIEKLIADEQSTYYIIRETISTPQISYRFNEDEFKRLVTGASQLTKLKGKKGVMPDFPYEITKKWKEPRRVFYLKQRITTEAYPQG